ncbi:MAG: hypothetical protein M3253_04610 [Chloroflexota bacterium]|nr:hypothetical protein [Chloroflexota bacterium]
MTEPYVFWGVLVGMVVGGVLVGMTLLRLPRRDDDVSDVERAAEAAWISSVVARRGRDVPAALVEEILELHAGYLAGPPLDLKPEDVEQPPATTEGTPMTAKNAPTAAKNRPTAAKNEP